MQATSQSNCASIPRAELIAQLNDELRKTGSGGQVMITRGVHALTGLDVSNLLRALADYDDFDATNDPHGERDFGAFDFRERELLWKVDYFDTELKFGSDDPADPNITRRVLTVMLAEEW